MTAWLIVMLLGLAHADDGAEPAPTPSEPVEFILPPLPDYQPMKPPRMPKATALTSNQGDVGWFVRNRGTGLVRVMVHWPLPPWAVMDAHSGLERLTVDSLVIDYEGSETSDHLDVLFGQGLDFHTSADDEGVSIEFACRPEDLGVLQVALGGVLAHKHFDERLVNHVRSRQMERLRQPESPDAAPTRVWFKALLDDHPRSRRPRGDRRALSRLGHEAVKRFYETWMTPNRARVLVVGDTTAERAQTATDDVLGHILKRRTPERPFKPRDPPGGQLGIVVHQEGLSQARILVGYSRRGMTREQLAALRVAIEILGRPISGRLDKRLRTEEGLTYGLSEGLFWVEDLLLGYLRLNVEADRAIEAVQVLRDELAKVSTDLDWDDVGPARRKLLARGIAPLMTTEGTFGLFAGFVANGGGPADVRRSFEGLSVADPTSVAEASAAFFRDEEIVVVVLGNADELEIPLRKTGLPVKVVGRR